MSRGALHVISPREASMFACLVDAVVAPGDRLPAVRDTDACVAFDANLAAAPRLNQLGLRAMLLALELAPLVLARPPRRTRLRRLAPAERAAVVLELDRHPVLGPVVKALRGIAHLTYYGDAAVMARLGFDAPAILERAECLRAEEGRW
ncbi:hypothetical protein [Paraconexibacter sp.]|uniref:hypothetical protein n=1 Tax=Paraconexibacter sp. TaxID=2949640 RepID=UPI00356460DA